MQERLTTQIASAVKRATSASGVLVVTDAVHLCMLSRGVRSEGCSTTTIVSKGSFRSDRERRETTIAALLP